MVPEAVMRAAVEAMFRAVGMSAADAIECTSIRAPFDHVASLDCTRQVVFTTADKHPHSFA